MSVQGIPSQCRELTTIVVRNVPDSWEVQDLVSLLWWQGFSLDFNFAYVPLHISSEVALGYAVVNMANQAKAQQFMGQIQGMRVPNQEKALVVEWCRKIQGLDGMVDRYRNSKVMHPNIADRQKPMVFHNGMPIRFPGPNRNVNAPRLRPVHL
mmetsp:Transcript_65707/g.129467  ORF Transcript_65707/g.129467 Transcript_65707/m.129467 type:complete len:153 (-) Transcript_65707:110-568(-)